MELEEFALGESAIGAARAETGAKGLKAAASTAASNLRRNMRSMLTAQQRQQQQQQVCSFLYFFMTCSFVCRSSAYLASCGVAVKQPLGSR